MKPAGQTYPLYLAERCISIHSRLVLNLQYKHEQPFRRPEVLIPETTHLNNGALCLRPVLAIRLSVYQVLLPQRTVEWTNFAAAPRLARLYRRKLSV